MDDTMTIAIPANSHAQIALPDASDHAAVQLTEWARAADAAWQLAEVLCSTKFAPVAYRNKTAEATAAILAGAEVGLSPMASLRAFDDIQGTPAPKAITLRAILQARGHEVRIDESTDQRAVVSARRKGDTAWQTSTWDIPRAERMGLTGKSEWKKQPGAMLIARATSEVCRWVASDAIMGMPYSAEELRDEGQGFEDRGPARRVTLAEVLDAEPTPLARATVERTEPVVKAPAEVPVEQPAPHRVDAQSRRMFALFNETAFKEREERLAFISEIVGREVASSNELTADDKSLVIAALERHIADTRRADAAGGGS